MKITVEHMIRGEQTGTVIGFDPVAIVDASAYHDKYEALEYAWRYTNNVVGSWSKKIGEDANDDVTVLQEREDGLGLRSSMVGDRFTVEDIFGTSVYSVMPFGFEKIDGDLLA
jgi:hypothetical protein